MDDGATTKRTKTEVETKICLTDDKNAKKFSSALAIMLVGSDSADSTSLETVIKDLCNLITVNVFKESVDIKELLSFSPPVLLKQIFDALVTMSVTEDQLYSFLICLSLCLFRLNIEEDKWDRVIGHLQHFVKTIIGDGRQYPSLVRRIREHYPYHWFVCPFASASESDNTSYEIVSFLLFPLPFRLNRSKDHAIFGRCDVHFMLVYSYKFGCTLAGAMLLQRIDAMLRSHDDVLGQYWTQIEELRKELYRKASTEVSNIIAASECLLLLSDSSSCGDETYRLGLEAKDKIIKNVNNKEQEDGMLLVYRYGLSCDKQLLLQAMQQNCGYAFSVYAQMCEDPEERKKNALKAAEFNDPYGFFLRGVCAVKDADFKTAYFMFLKAGRLGVEEAFVVGTRLLSEKSEFSNRLVLESSMFINRTKKEEKEKVHLEKILQLLFT